MPIPVAIVGTGNVAQALGRRWHEGGVQILGLLGRDPVRTRRAIDFVGAGRVLERADLARATVVVLAIADPALPTLVEHLGRDGLARQCSLWLHTSGRYGVDVLEPLTSSRCRTAALHPVCPIPDPESGAAAIPGRFALVEAGPGAERLATTLAERAGLRPVVASIRDRAAYHAATALAANGTTALLALAARVLAGSGTVAPQTAERIVADLGGAATRAVGAGGAVAALSGPVARGDAATVTRHRAALAGGPGADAYLVLMRAALELAIERGLDRESAARVAEALDGVEGHDG